MKKLIAISVVFALVAGVAFAVDLSGTVIGGVNVIQAQSGTRGDGSAYPVTAGGYLGRVRLDGSGEVADGKFGGYLRLDAKWRGDLNLSFTEFDHAYAWWKPIDQLKLIIGQFPDGFWGQDGNSRWMFYQGATDTFVTFGGDHAWGGSDLNDGLNLGQAFCGGYGAGGVFLEINPVDMVAINIGLPFFGDKEIGDVFKSTFAQVALNLSFGTIAFSYQGDTTLDASSIYGYFGLKAIDNLQIDFGLGSDFSNATPLNLGLAVKYSTDSWGIKFRSLFAVPVGKEQEFGILFDILPYFVINDNFRVYISGGVAIYNVKGLTAGGSWHVNPYIEVGEEWGPRFFAGIKVHQAGALKADTDLSISTADVKFSVPIALMVSF